MEVGAADLHNEDYVFSNEISLKFQNQQKFWRFRQISLSKMWLELWREHENPHHFLVSKISDFVSPKAIRGPEARESVRGTVGGAHYVRDGISRHLESFLCIFINFLRFS